MRHFIILLILASITGCKEDLKEEQVNTVDSTKLVAKSIDSLEPVEYSPQLERELSIEKKQMEFVKLKDEREELEALIFEKNFLKEEDLYTLDFRYPLLNENLKPSHVNFNEYINEHYVDILGTEAGILEDIELICDTIRTNRQREKRFIDYKIYNVNDQLVSILFYKENFYSGTLHPTYSFDCMNFDLNRGVFMNYEDFFIEGSEEEFRDILNDIVEEKIEKGEMYYDCWKISENDFFDYKDNFVLNDTYVSYYFDDCVICPSYTGSYSVEIPLVKLLPVLKRYNLNPLVF